MGRLYNETEAWNEEYNAAVDTVFELVDSIHPYANEKRVPMPCGRESQVFDAVVSKLRANGLTVGNRWLRGDYIDPFGQYWACWSMTACDVIPCTLEPALEVVQTIVEDYNKMRRWPRFLKEKRLPYIADALIPAECVLANSSPCRWYKGDTLSYKVKQAIELVLKSSGLELLGYNSVYVDDKVPVENRFVIYIGGHWTPDMKTIWFLKDLEDCAVSVRIDGESNKFLYGQKLSPMHRWAD